jgi:hypothetical protein
MPPSRETTTLAQLFANIGVWTDRQIGQPLALAPANLQKDLNTAATMLGQLTEGMDDPWTGNRICRIVRKTSRYIVFLDEHLNIRWWWVLQPDMAAICAVQSRITELIHESAFLLEERPGRSKEPRRPSEVPDTFTLEAANIRCVIGEAMALALNGGTVAECEKVLAEAEQYITVAKDQRCRPKFVLYFILTVACIGIGAFAVYQIFPMLEDPAKENIHDWLEAAFAGSFGALISALTRTTELKLEPAAKRSGLAVEAAARAMIGAAAGILVDFAFHGGLLVEQAIQVQFQDAVRLFLCLAAGISERMLPALVSKADDLISKPPTPDTTIRNQSAPQARPPATANTAAVTPAEDQAVG